MGLLISKNYKPGSDILWREYSLCSFYEKVGPLTDCPFRRFDQALGVYERNHTLALKLGHSNEGRIFVPVPLTSDMNLVDWRHRSWYCS
jgi:hypothetical protein